MIYPSNPTTVAYKDVAAKVTSDYWKRRDELSDTLDSQRDLFTAEMAAEIQPLKDAYVAAIALNQAKCETLIAPFLAEFKAEFKKNDDAYDASMAAIEAEYGVS